MSDGTFLVTGHVDAPTGAAAGAEYSMELGSVDPAASPGSPDMVLMNWETPGRRLPEPGVERRGAVHRPRWTTASATTRARWPGHGRRASAWWPTTGRTRRWTGQGPRSGSP